MKAMKNSKNFWRFLSFLLTVIAVVSGGGAMAVGTVENPDLDNMSKEDPASDHDPVDPDTNDRKTPGGDSAGQDLTGTQATATQLRDGGLEDAERESDIVVLRPHKVPLLKIMSRVAKTRTTPNYEVDHARVGGETMDGTTTQAITGGDTIKLTKSNFSGNLMVFRKYDILCIPSMGGFKPGSQTEHNGEFLCLEVVERDKTGITCCSINGPAAVQGQTGDEYDYQTVPNIPADTYIMGMWNAMSETQILVTPDNFQPRERKVYCQKHGWNVEFSEEFEKAKKKYPVKVANLLEDAMIKDGMRCERGYWVNPMAKRKRMNERGVVQDVFYTEGLVYQIPNFYAIGSEFLLSDLIAINKLQFTDFATSDRAFAFCGKNFIERLENINPGKNREIHFENASEFDLTFRRFKDTFGTINYIWDQTLDFMGFADYGFVLDMDNAVHYLKESKRSRTNDNSQGAGEIDLSKTHWEYSADALALKGYNSIIIGPENNMWNMQNQGIINYIISSNVLPDVAHSAVNMKIALTSDYELNGVTYEKGNVYICSAKTSESATWTLYTGTDVAV